ncbi:FG-GAP-like repeat-containing protein [Streptomyces sp. NPDC056480]|uniref:FG-GAP-like repeat-containing protein n=1 Tax=Streptomyces sp. NPDC056480 TaxID=3345833 RepID=UPI0036854890
MSSARTSRRHVSVAITTVLAVTLGAGALAAPASAAPATAVVAKAADATTTPLAYAGGALLGAGTTGYLTRNGTDENPELRWTTFADGTSTVLPATRKTRAEVYVSGSSDILMTSEEGRYNGTSQHITLRNLSTGAAPVDIDFTKLGADHRFAGLVGSTLLARGTGADGVDELLLLDATGDGQSARRVTGLPEGAIVGTVAASRPGTALVNYAVHSGTDISRYLVTVDLATAAVTGPAYDVMESRYAGDTSALSAAHAAWPESGDRTVKLVIADLGSGTVRRIPVGEGGTAGTNVGLVGSWVTYGTPTGLDDEGTTAVPPLQTFTARSLTSEETIPLLDHMTHTVAAPDGTLLAFGGTVEKGEGLYRIAAGADGRPAAELVATTGQPTRLTYLGDQFRHLDLDGDPSKIHLKWRMSRVNADVYLKLTHRRTGETFSLKMHVYRESAGAYYYDDQTFGLTWAEIAQSSKLGRLANSGHYDWSFRAVPQNGIGPALEAKGEFYAKRTSDPHDLSENRTPDLIARDSEGLLWQIDTAYDAAGKTLVATGPRDPAGYSWHVYDRIESIGNIGGAGGDFVARDRDGVLWIYDGAGVGFNVTFPPRTRIGGGWNTYTELTGGSDLNGDGKPDLVAVDKTGDLYLYPSSTTRPTLYNPRKKVGHGWEVYDQITATGNIGGNPAGDLVARDKAGKLWLYLGKGDGTFATRTPIGNGWGPYTDLVGIGDGNGDGTPDLYARGTGNTSYFYAGTGDWKYPFKARTASSVLGDDENNAYDKVS